MINKAFNIYSGEVQWKFIIKEEIVEEKVDDSWISIVMVLLARQRGSDASTSLEGIVHTLSFLVLEIASGIHLFLWNHITI